MNKFYFQTLIFLGLFSLSIKSTEISNLPLNIDAEDGSGNLYFQQDDLYLQIVEFVFENRCIDLTEHGLDKYDFAKEFLDYLESYHNVLIWWEMVHEFYINFNKSKQINTEKFESERKELFEQQKKIYDKYDKNEKSLIALAEIVGKDEELDLFLDKILLLKKEDLNVNLEQMNIDAHNKQFSMIKKAKDSLLNFIDLFKTQYN